MSNLVGQYQTANTSLQKLGEKVHLIIGTRKKTTPQKPVKYLLQRLSPSQHIFISSLYQWQEMTENGKQAYSFDYKGIEYVLMIDPVAGIGTISLLDKTARKGAAQAND